GKVADQIAKVTSAKGRASATELLNLAVVSAQLRAAQAQPARRDGEPAELPAVPPLETPLGDREIDPLYRALTSWGGGRSELVESAIERGVVRDLRLLDPWLAALSDQALAELSARAVPMFGEAAVAPLTAALRLDGGAADVRRLGCLAKLQG